MWNLFPPPQVLLTLRFALVNNNSMPVLSLDLGKIYMLLLFLGILPLPTLG